MSEEKKTIAFSFSKTKSKPGTVINTTSGAFSRTTTTSDEKVELITSIEGKKLNRADGTMVDKPKAVIIPVEPNRQIIAFKKQKTEMDSCKTLVGDGKNSDDLEAVKALMKDSAKRKDADENSVSVKIDIKDSGGAKTDVIGKDLEQIEAADYEAVGLEQFGKACLLGMGWNEKEGIGTTNKRKIAIVEPELRPKGLGLGAGHKSSKNHQKEAENSMRYVKGAFIEITDGKNKSQVGEIVGFDDSNSRLFIKIPGSDKLIAVLQSCTQLLTKTEYQSILNKRKR